MLSASRLAVSALCRQAVRISPKTAGLLRTPQAQGHPMRQFMQQQRTNRLEKIIERRKTLKEMAMSPATDARQCL